MRSQEAAPYKGYQVPKDKPYVDPILGRRWTVKDMCNTQARRDFAHKLCIQVHQNQEVREILGIQDETVDDTIQRIEKALGRKLK